MSGRSQPRARGGNERPKISRETSVLGGEQVEGRQAVRELLRAGRRTVLEIWMTPSKEAPVLEEISDLASATRVRVRKVTHDELAARARTDAPQGVLAIAEPVEPADLDAMLARPDAFVVALDGVTDPGNLGAVLRVAETAGVTGVIIPRHRSARLSPAAVKAAAGAVELLPIAAVAGVPAMLDRVGRVGMWAVGLDAGGDADVFDLAVADRPLVLVLGAEGRRISRLARDLCDVIASIPMHGRLDSLNVAAAAAVACHAIARQRGR